MQQWDDCFFSYLWNFNQHLIKSASCVWFTVKQMLQSFIKSGSVVWETVCVCDRRMDGLSHTSPDFIVILQIIAHCMSPLTTQHRSHIQAMCNRETDGSTLITACWQRFSSQINIGVCAWVCTSASVHACAGNAVVCPGVRHVNRELEFQMLPLLLICDIAIHFDAGPSSAYTNTQKHTRTHVTSDSWSLIKSLAFVIIQNWLKNKGGIHGIKNKCSFQSTSVQMGPRHTARLLLVIEFGCWSGTEASTVVNWGSATVPSQVPLSFS